jgi:hypothetical protein
MNNNVKELEQVIETCKSGSLTFVSKYNCQVCKDKGRIFCVNYIGQKLALIKNKKYEIGEYALLWVQQAILEFVSKPIDNDKFALNLREKIMKEGKQYFYWLIDDPISNQEKLFHYFYLINGSSFLQYEHKTESTYSYCNCDLGSRLRDLEGEKRKL